MKVQFGILSLAAGILMGCGSEGVLWQTPAEKLARLSSFEEILDKGRSVHFPITVSESPLHFAPAGGGEAVDVVLERNQQSVSWQSYDIDTMPAVALEDLSADALNHIDSNVHLFGVTSDQLRPTPRPLIWISDRLVSVSFNRFYQDVPVRDAFVEVIYVKGSDGSFRLREVMNRSYGAMSVEGAPQPPALEEVFAQLGRDDLHLVNEQSLVLPRASQDGFTFVYATEFQLASADGEDFFTVYMSDENKEVLEAVGNKIHAVKAVKAKVYERSYFYANKMADIPLSMASVSSGNSTIDLDRDGRGDIPVGDATLRLQSARGSVYESGKNSVFGVAVNFEAGDTLVEGSGKTLAALNAFSATHRINRFVRRHLKEGETDNYLAHNIKVNVMVSGACNAFFNPQSIEMSFYQEGTAQGNTCGNTAMINDVVYHEWGHGLDNATGKNPGIKDNAYSEGIGDIVSAYYTNNSNLGPGFIKGKEAGIRNLKNSKKYPDDAGGKDPHGEGEIIGGAFWDLREALIERHGEVKGAYMAEMYFLKNLTTTDSYKESYQAVLRLDDNDGNPKTRSPNHCLITEAFAGHGLATEEAGCQDPEVKPAYPVLDALKVAIKDQAGGKATLMASMAGNGSLSGCLGDRAACENSPKDDIVFDLEGQKNGYLFFVTKAPVALSGQMHLTLIAKDSSGQITGMRTVKFVER